MSSEWWQESRRNQVLGHGIRWGNKWAHVTQVRDSGPGANSINALCHGVQSICHINSGLDLENQEECEEWKRRDVRIPLGSPIAEVVREKRMARICPKCSAIYEKKLQAA